MILSFFNLCCKRTTSQQCRDSGWSLRIWSCWEREGSLPCSSSVGIGFSVMNLSQKQWELKGRSDWLSLVEVLHPFSCQDFLSENQCLPYQAHYTRLCPWFVRLQSGELPQSIYVFFARSEWLGFSKRFSKFLSFVTTSFLAGRRIFQEPFVIFFHEIFHS